MIRLTAFALTAALCASALPASPLAGDKTYDMLFRTGTLDRIDRAAELVYRREVASALKPEAEGRDTGDIALSFREGEAPLALLEFRQDGKHRALGSFPASVGNPMIMYFYETVVRDMAEAAGGSPFYIRNRVKDALIQTSDIQQGEAVVGGKTVRTQTIRLYPFADDPNRDRMRGFGDLELRVTMSEEVPGWYMSLVAEASGGDVYKSEILFDRVDGQP
ncbi:hypothetical protein [Roseobacter sinensis]|uniref:Uncharacterized protein n=1 Tax=Roseobacter sinensis TaxID=2931391 RepID=A0ABT3BKG0_9RHOB|nr:hypothetical protein [Roseobacter sp. WL0113]MCV3274062.1 hypothetical protein [Roseobacter sp. WL0113]